MRNSIRDQFAELVERLRLARLNQGRSLKSVSDEIGAGSSMLMYWEKGDVLPNAAYFIAWVQALGFYVDITDAETEET